MNKSKLPTDPDLLGSIQAIKRSAASVLKLARKTHTPCYVVEKGTIVNVAERSNATVHRERIVAK